MPVKKKSNELIKVHTGNRVIHTNLAQDYMSVYQNLPTYNITDLEYSYFANPAQFLMLGEYEGRKLVLDDFQIGIINSRARYNFGVKARQMGFSTMCVAGRALAMSYLYPRRKSIICSYNLVEAKEKIKIAKDIQMGVHKEISLSITMDNALGLGLSNGSCIYSVFSPRGHNNSDLYLDEFSIVEDQRAIYRDAFPIVARQTDKQMFIGGTPYGKIGLFWDIYDSTDGKYRDYRKFIWYWWDSPFYTANVALARQEAYKYLTAERVYKFGTPALIEIFENNLLEDFQQEYEGYFCDETTSFFSYALIKQCMNYWADFKNQETYPINLDGIGDHIRGTLYAGFDVGRTRNTSEFYVFDFRKEKGKRRLIQIFHKSFDDVAFEEQEFFLETFIQMYEDKIGSLQIDRTLIGMELAERLMGKYPQIVLGINFSNESKERMATITKIFAAAGLLELLPERETITQFHSLKQMLTPTGKTKYDTEKNTKHHADRFWAVALAVDGANQERQIRPDIIMIKSDEEEQKLSSSSEFICDEDNDDDNTFFDYRIKEKGESI